MYGTCQDCGATCTRVYIVSRGDDAGTCARCIAATTTTEHAHTFYARVTLGDYTYRRCACGSFTAERTTTTTED